MKNSLTLRRAASIVIALGLHAFGLQSIAHADSSIEARYRSERAVCMSGQSNQDRATCLKEAGAARAEARRNRLDTGSVHLQENARARCAALSGDDRADCDKRMSGEGSVSGSVQDGGVLREMTTVVPAK